MDESNIRQKSLDILAQQPADTASLKELEAEIDRVLCQVGREMLQHELERLEEANPAPITRCRWCGHDAYYFSNRVSFVSTRFGQLRYRRAYYLCRHCFRNTCPLDERLNPYKSLARLRAKIEAGYSLPVDELASAWGLGSLESGSWDHSFRQVSPSVFTVQDRRDSLHP